MELRRQGITDTRVLRAIEKVPREVFVPETFRDQAYENRALPIGQGQTISQPYVVALMSQALDCGDRMKVLEIGTGSGYQAAVLAHLCRRVYTVERYRDLMKIAEQRFAECRISNIVTRIGDGTKGWPEQAPFDRIIVTAAAQDAPEALLEQLADGGIMVIPVGRDPLHQELIKVVRKGEEFERTSLGGVRFVPLVPGALPDARGDRDGDI
jgi:protein-L-isoaspartate(D-aspartate) O-methyltransferase